MQITLQLIILGLWTFIPSALAAFGVTTSSGKLVVDSGAGLVTTGGYMPR